MDRTKPTCNLLAKKVFNKPILSLNIRQLYYISHFASRERLLEFLIDYIECINNYYCAKYVIFGIMQGNNETLGFLVFAMLGGEN